MAIDRGNQNEYILTGRVGVPAAASSKTHAGSPEESSKVLTAVGRSVPEALSLLNSQAERRASYVQCRSILISEAIAHDGLQTIIDTFNRYREFRKTIAISLIKGSPAREMLLLDMPILEMGIARLVESIADVERESNFAPYANLLQLSNALAASHRDSLIPVISINPQVLEEKKGTMLRPKPSVDFIESVESTPNIVNTQPGEMNRSGGTPADLIGAGVLVQGKLAVYLSGEESRIASILRNTYQTGIWKFPDSRAPGKYVSVVLMHSTPMQIKVDTSVQPIRIQMASEVEGVLMEVPAYLNTINEAGLQEMEALISQSLSQQALQLIERMQSIPADPFDLVRPLQWRTWTLSAFERLPWREMFQTAEVNVTIHAHLRRIGTHGEPVAPTVTFWGE